MLRSQYEGEIVAVDAAFTEKTGIDLPYDQLATGKYTIDEFSEMGGAWYAVCKDTLDELIKLKVANQSEWMVKVDDAGLASHLIWDLIEMTCWIPYKGKEINMKNIAFNCLIVCPDNHNLAKFFK